MRLSFCIALLLATATAHAGTSWIELVPESSGPYQPGSFLDVDVVFHNMEGQTIQVRLVTLDFSVTDAALSLPGNFSFQLGPPLVYDGAYARFELMPKVDIAYFLTEPLGGYILDILDGGAYTLGTLTVGLPNDPGMYVLDAMNRAAPDTNTGARLDYGFNPRTTLHWLNANLNGNLNDNPAGGQLAMAIAPDPTTLVLLALGGIGACIHRRYVRG